MGIPNEVIQEPQNSEAVKIIVRCDAAARNYELSVAPDTTVSDIIQSIRDACKEEGHDINKWLEQEVGRGSQMVLMRKATGNTVLSPAATFGELKVQENEVFTLAAQPVVG